METPPGLFSKRAHLIHRLNVCCMYRSVTLALSRCILALRFAVPVSMDPKTWPLFDIWRTRPPRWRQS